MTLDYKTIYDACEEGIGGSRYCGVTLVVDEILGVLSDEHGKVWPGPSGG